MIVPGRRYSNGSLVIDLIKDNGDGFFQCRIIKSIAFKKNEIKNIKKDCFFFKTCKPVNIQFK